MVYERGVALAGEAREQIERLEVRVTLLTQSGEQMPLPEREEK